MKKSILMLFAAVVSACCWSCGATDKGANADSATEAGITVDQALSNPDSLVGDTIVIEGVVSHLCRQGGRKAFVAGEGDNAMLRCEAYPLMGEPFAKEAVSRPIKVRAFSERSASMRPP